MSSNGREKIREQMFRRAAAWMNEEDVANLSNENNVGRGVGNHNRSGGAGPEGLVASTRKAPLHQGTTRSGNNPTFSRTMPTAVPNKGNNKKMATAKEGGTASNVAVFCEICQNLYTESNDRAPVILIPCGHSFCQSCVLRRAAAISNQNGVLSCPACHQDVKQTAINHELRKLAQRQREGGGGESEESGRTQTAPSHSYSGYRPPQRLDTEALQGTDAAVMRHSYSQPGMASQQQQQQQQQGAFPLPGVRDRAMISGGEGPLPAKVMQKIEMNCVVESRESAELYARRLLSNLRHNGVFEAELRSAIEENGELQRSLDKNGIVLNTLHKEVIAIDERIAALQQEKQICEMQLEEEKAARARYEGKVEECARRIESLEMTTEEMRREIQRGNTILQQLVPGLDIEEYVW